MLLEPAVFPRRPRPPGYGVDAHAYPGADPGAWGAARSWLAPGDPAIGGLIACLALRAARGRQVVVQCDVHAQLQPGLICAGLAPHWLAPAIDRDCGVAHGVAPEALDAALGGAPGARSAIVVAPAYHGAQPDIGALAAVAHAHGAALVVDEAWGGHLPFHPDLPEHAIAAGADLVLARARGVVLIHHGADGERWLPADAIERAAALLGPVLRATSAPAGDRDDRARVLGLVLRDAAAARARLSALPGVRVLGPELAGAPGVHAFDPLRLTIDVRDSGRDARAVAAALRARRGPALDRVTDRLLVAELGRGGGRLGRGARIAAALAGTLWTVPPADSEDLADGRGTIAAAAGARAARAGGRFRAQPCFP